MNVMPWHGRHTGSNVSCQLMFETCSNSDIRLWLFLCQALTVLFCIIFAYTDTLHGQRAQEALRHGQEYTEQRLPMHTDAPQQAYDHAHRIHHEGNALNAEERQQRTLDHHGVLCGACNLQYHAAQVEVRGVSC